MDMAKILRIWKNMKHLLAVVSPIPGLNWKHGRVKWIFMILGYMGFKGPI